MVDFLLHESADFLGQLGRGTIAVGLDRFDEERLTARERGGQRVVPGGGNRIAVEPPALGLAVAPETAVAHGDREIARGGNLAVGGGGLYGPREFKGVAHGP